MKLRLLTTAFLFTTLFSIGQTKVGTIDSDLVVGLMPETKKVLSMLNKYAKKLDSSYQIKYKDYQDKIASFKKAEKDFSDNYKKIKLQEIGELEKTLQQNQSNANKLIQLKKNELMRPLLKKFKGVVSEVAKANGYTQIITTTKTDFAYLDTNHDITQRVLKKMGIEIPKQ